MLITTNKFGIVKTSVHLGHKIRMNYLPPQSEFTLVCCRFGKSDSLKFTFKTNLFFNFARYSDGRIKLQNFDTCKTFLRTSTVLESPRHLIFIRIGIIFVRHNRYEHSIKNIYAFSTRFNWIFRGEFVGSNRDKNNVGCYYGPGRTDAGAT